MSLSKKRKRPKNWHSPLHKNKYLSKQQVRFLSCRADWRREIGKECLGIDQQRGEIAYS